MQPLASLKALADPIYEAFYGLTEQPFAITTDPRFFYLSASHQAAFDELLAGLQRREALVLLTGETGSGKTTLCRAVVEALGPRTFCAMILNPYMSGAEVFRIILRDFGLVTHEELRRGGLASADVPQLLDTLEGFLQSLVPLDTHAVIILDEAQSLSPQVLDQVRLLTGLEQDHQRLVQVVLCGQPGLIDTLKTEAMSATSERITRRVALNPLPIPEVEAYIRHRIGVAGGAEAVSFDPAAVRVIAELSHGLPRRVNVLCDRALQEGRIEGVNTIGPELVKRGARAIAGAHDPIRAAPPDYSPPSGSTATMFGAAAADDERHDRPARSMRQILIAAIGGLALLLALGYGYGVYSTVWSSPAPPPAPAGPVKRVGTPAGPLPIPPPDETAALMAPPPRPAQVAPASGQNPDDRH